MIDAIYHEEGRATPSATSWQYEYYLKDHLGNTRVIFTDSNNDGTPEIIQEADYYPFGMRHSSSTTATNHYLYNGKELNEDLGLDWYDYGFRWYDAELGRFPSVDPMAENRLDMTPFNYVSNNPISRIDPNGLTDFYYKSQNGSMTYLGTDGILNGVIAVISDQNVVQQFLGNTSSYINPPVDSYFELPAYQNRQAIKAEILAHYGDYLSKENSTSDLIYKIVRYEIGGVGVLFDDGTEKEVTALPGKANAGRPVVDIFRAKDLTQISEQYTYMATFEGGNGYKRINRKYVVYTWHTHPYTSATNCYYKASDKDLSPNSSVGQIRNNFVIAPFNNSVALYRLGKTTSEMCKFPESSGASEIVPLNWFLNIEHSLIQKLPTIPIQMIQQN